jgi:hypothetical protein
MFPKKIFFKNKVFFFIISLILLIFISSRLLLFPVHFGHGDDTAIGHIIWIFNSYNSLELKSKLAEYNKDFYLLFYVIDNFSFTFPIIKFLLTPFAISENSSYAPLQFFVTKLLSNFDLSYKFSLISIRFMSVFSSFISIIFLFLFLKKLEKKNNELLLIVSIAILSLSWMYLTYSSLALNAGSIVLVSSIFLYILTKLDSSNISFKISALVGFLTILLLLLHYQSIIFLPGFYLSLLYLCNFKFKIFFKKWLPCLIINTIGFLIIYFHYLNRISTVHWNAGVNSEFLFDHNVFSQSLYYILNYIFTFFTKNLFLTLQSIVSFTDLQGYFSKIYTSLIIFFSIFSFFFFDKKKKEIASVFIFILATFGFWFILIILQKITLSPTRHSLFILIPISFLASYGFYLFIRKIKLNYENGKAKFLCYIFLFGLLIIYVNNFFIERHNRLDPFQNIKYEEILKKHKVSSIVTYDFPPSQFYFPYINKNFIHKVGPSNSVIYYKKNNDLKDQSIAFVGTRNTFADSTYEYNYYRGIINFIYSKSFKDYNYKKDYYKDSQILKDNNIKKDLELIYEYNFKSSTEVDYGNLTKNGSNNLLIKIFRIK